MSDFERALQKVLVHEGGYSDHPKDPGGATNKGVTQAVYDAYRRSKGVSTQTVRSISTPELVEIYKRRYWDLHKGDQMPPAVAYVVFDGAVNSGVGQSVKWLQRALVGYYTGPVDGLVGPGTIDAINRVKDHKLLITVICEQRLAFLKALRTWPTFGKGWSRRVQDVCSTGHMWAGAYPPASMVGVWTSDEATAKAPVSDQSTAPSTAPGDVIASGGTVSAVIGQAIDQISPYATIPSISKIVMFLTVAGVVLAVGGVLYRLWAARKARKLAEALA